MHKLNMSTASAFDRVRGRDVTNLLMFEFKRVVKCATFKLCQCSNLLSLKLSRFIKVSSTVSYFFSQFVLKTFENLKFFGSNQSKI